MYCATSGSGKVSDYRDTGSEKRRKEKAEVQLPNTVEEERKKKRKSWFYLNDRDNNL